MRIVVSDSSCLIDLRKASLLDTFLRLPYEFLIPDTLFDEELLKFTAIQKNQLISGGLKIMDLPGERVLRAREVARAVPQLSVHDAFAFALAESHPGCILLTGDGELRRFAVEQSVEVHGVLWIFDEIHRCSLASVEVLVSGLRTLTADPTVRLPRGQLAACIRRYQDLATRGKLRRTT